MLVRSIVDIENGPMIKDGSPEGDLYVIRGFRRKVEGERSCVSDCVVDVLDAELFIITRL